MACPKPSPAALVSQTKSTRRSVKLRHEADSDYSGHISHKLGDSTWCVEESSACLKVRTQANSTRNPYAQVAELARADLLAVEESVPGRAGSSLQSKKH